MQQNYFWQPKHSKVTVLEVTAPHVKQNKTFLDQHCETVRGLPGVRKIHYVAAGGGNSVEYSTVAKMPTKNMQSA